MPRGGDNYVSWTTEEVALLVRLVTDRASWDEISPQFGGRTKRAIRDKMRALGINPTITPTWSAERDARLRAAVGESRAGGRYTNWEWVGQRCGVTANSAKARWSATRRGLTRAAAVEIRREEARVMVRMEPTRRRCLMCGESFVAWDRKRNWRCERCSDVVTKRNLDTGPAHSVVMRG